MVIEYTESKKHAIFNNTLFCRDDKTGYYLNSNTSTRLHRAVWEYYNGAIPVGYEIHHIDHDKGNNDISNLCMMTAEAHRKLHADELTEEQKEKLRQNLIDTAIPKATEWHKSADGRNWHKRHFDQMRDSLYVLRRFTCENCGAVYETYDHGTNRFCSNRCRAENRRKSGVDNEERICVICGGTFDANKYSKAKTCSSRCRSVLRWGAISPQGWE